MEPRQPGDVVPLRQILRELPPLARMRLRWRLLTGRREFVVLGGLEEYGDRERPHEQLPDVDSWTPQLLGKSIRRVSYSVIPGLEWDSGEAWHSVGVAVELSLDDGTEVTVLAHPEAGVRLSDEPASKLYAYDRTPERDRDVTDHPLWGPLIDAPVQSVDVPLSEPVGFFAPEPTRLPLALHLTFEQGEVWIAAAESTPWEEGEFTLLADNIIVVFDAGLAQQMGLSQ